MSSILKPLVELLHWVLIWIHDALASMGLGRQWTWGLAIIGLTIIVRLIMFPLTWKQYKSSRAMQALAPHIKELQKKHKGDRATLQQETMKLYQEHRVNPFASCLPLILQLPVFFALYWTIKGTDYLPKAETVALSTAPFLWLPHLGKPDPYYILLVIYIVTQLISTELMLTPQTDKTAEDDDARDADHVRLLPQELPVRTLRLLGDDEPVDDRPAAHHPQEDADRRPRGGRRQQRRRGEGRQGRAAAEEAGPLHGGDDGRPGAAQDAARGAPQGRRGWRRSEGGSAAKKGAGEGGSAAKSGAKKGGKRPPPGKGARAKQTAPAPDIDEDDDKPPYR